MAHKFYAGIGSRKTPPDILALRTCIASRLAGSGYVLRSGGAYGADTAFESALDECDAKQIFYAKDATTDSLAVARAHHPAWDVVGREGKSLLGRNAMIILGEHLTEPVDFVVGWHEGSGGTRHSFTIAKAHGIKTYNLAIMEEKSEFLRWLDQSSD